MKENYNLQHLELFYYDLLTAVLWLQENHLKSVALLTPHVFSLARRIAAKD